MPSRIQQRFIQVALAAVIAFGISLPARADDFPVPTDAVSPLEDTNHRSRGKGCDAAWYLFYEADHKGTQVSGLSTFCPGFTTYAGLAVQQIRSPKITYEGQQDNLESLYFFLGRQMDRPITPFIEAGIDLGDLLAESLLKNSGNDDANNTGASQNESSLIDYYFAIGIQARLRQSLFMRTY